jgi:hypothetical protein
MTCFTLMEHLTTPAKWNCFASGQSAVRSHEGGHPVQEGFSTSFILERQKPAFWGGFNRPMFSEDNGSAEGYHRSIVENWEQKQPNF